MRIVPFVSTAAVLLGVSNTFGAQVVLSPLDDAQDDRATFASPDVFSNPPPVDGPFIPRQLTTPGEFHQGLLEYSLASLPANAVVTSASFTYGVNLISLT